MRRITRWLLFLLLIIGAGGQLNGQSVTIGWTASTDPSVTGYNIYWGTVSGTYTDSVNAGTNTTVTISGLAAGSTYYFAARSSNAAGIPSSYTPEKSHARRQEGQERPSLSRT